MERERREGVEERVEPVGEMLLGRLRVCGKGSEDLGSGGALAAAGADALTACPLADGADLTGLDVDRAFVDALSDAKGGDLSHAKLFRFSLFAVASSASYCAGTELPGAEVCEEDSRRTCSSLFILDFPNGIG